MWLLGVGEERGEVQFGLGGEAPPRPKWHPAFGAAGVQTVPENPANAGTVPLQRPVPLTLRRAWTSAAQTSPWSAAGWDVATVLLLFCASTMGNLSVSSCEPPLFLNPTAESPCESITWQRGVAKSPISTVIPFLSSSQPETLTYGVPPA